ncbi:phosphatase PAP2 family protein [Variovorax sp. VNK109]|uniref:phosphatase PAP2 family protein n=1 Tax=Variovorax sp. VNK109 TaxID=3400919 RepID=UPI003C067242
MNSPEIALFLWINAGPQTPSDLILLAKYASLYLPGLSIAALLATAVWRPALRDAALQTVLALLLAWIAARLLRHGLAMPRPAVLGLGIQWIDHSGGPGLPSLHASGAFAFACSLLLSRVPRMAMIAGFGVAALIAWSRLCLGVHFPADILCGAVVGLLSAQLARGLTKFARGFRRETSTHHSAGTPVPGI